jgi:methylisocitrate lyase
MIEDQTWPKSMFTVHVIVVDLERMRLELTIHLILGCGHTKGKSVVSRGEAFARVQAACDARDEGQDIFILARTDSLILGWDEAMARAKEFKKIGADAVFIEALPDRAAMQLATKELDMPLFANST